MSLKLTQGKVYINEALVTDPNIIGKYLLSEAKESDEIEVNFREHSRQMTAAHTEMTKLNDWMILNDGEKACEKLPILELTGFQPSYRSTAVLMQYVTAFNNKLLTIKKTK